MTHPIIAAAREFQKDEERREKRGQTMRMPDVIAGAHLRQGLNAAEATSLEQHDDNRVQRGMVAVEIFDYSDTFDEKAATVITDILHAAAASGWTPQAVLDRAARYYAEER